MSWKSEKQHILPYTGSADGLETWIDVELGRNRWRAEKSYGEIIQAAHGLAYECSGLILRETKNI